MEDQHRQLYPDVCKFVAIYIVTSSHCAQCISSKIWTNFLGGTEIDIAFNMPLFMLMSGWFLNFEKLRSTIISQYIIAKFKRLIIPAISWYLIYCLLTIHNPSIDDAITFYWYLTALFICLSIILIAAKIIQNDLICVLLSTTIVIVCPYSDFANINFMFPYLWTGYYLRKVLDGNKTSVNNTMALCSLFIGIVLSIYWTPNQTVYKCPLKVLTINKIMILTYLYRFFLGLSISAFFICIIKKYEGSKLMNYFAQYGQYSLLIYTFSFVFNGLLTKLLVYNNIHTNEYLVIDFLSLLLSTLIVTLSIYIGKRVKNNHITSLIFLGE